MQYVFGYTVLNDVTARDQQKADVQFTRAKSYDSFCPLGPWIETELDPSELRISTELDDVVVQDGSTADMVFSIGEFLEYVSGIMTLLPGDVLLTGTPAGVGLGQKPAPWYLKPGDVVRLGATGLGEQRQICVGGEGLMFPTARAAGGWCCASLAGRLAPRLSRDQTTVPGGRIWHFGTTRMQSRLMTLPPA